MGIIIKPIVTEKMTVQGEKLNRYGFIVDRDANKLEIKAAVRSITGKKKSEVAEKLRKATAAIDAGTYIAPSKMTVGYFYRCVLSVYFHSVFDDNRHVPVSSACPY